MAFDVELASRMREVLAVRNDVTEKKMFGGLCFMVRGHMCCGIARENFMLRVGPDRYEEVLSRRHARPMDFTGRPLKGFVYVAPAGLKAKRDLVRWIGLGLDFVESLPAKTAKKAKAKNRG
ncbi:MAG: TfoX/Sxy family protein [Rhodospirillaceae bacterium]|nr:TfoX/Sxy family protein [Rhodospirillaceae bacterium]